MSGKGSKRRWGNENLVRENWPFPERKTSQEWCSELNVFVIDPDGWNRKDLDKSWAEKITEQEFWERFGRSTAMLKVPDKAANVPDGQV